MNERNLTSGRTLSARTKLELSTKLDFCVLGLGAMPDLISGNPSDLQIPRGGHPVGWAGWVTLVSSLGHIGDLGKKTLM